ncbi:MAG: hypothetical protein JST00_18710 [Deltaproteobacteria bacterium]|nr:hypothetical protein [Deltaproteobacteria bacterium]
MKLAIRADMDLEQTSFVTWLDVDVKDASGATGRAKIAIVHVGEITDALGDVLPALRGTSLEALASVYFTEGWYREAFADGAGIDLVFFERIEMTEDQRARNIDLALVRRICDTLGSGCQLAVMPYGDPMGAAHWARLGFALTTPGRARGLMHMKLGYRHAAVVDATGRGDFEVLPTTAFHDRHTAN